MESQTSQYKNWWVLLNSMRRDFCTKEGSFQEHHICHLVNYTQQALPVDDENTLSCH